MGNFNISVSCFDDCHNSVMGVVVVACQLKNYLSNDHFRTNIFNCPQQRHTSYYKGKGGSRGLDLILHIVYLSRRLRSRAVEYFSHIEH